MEHEAAARRRRAAGERVSINAHNNGRTQDVLMMASAGGHQQLVTWLLRRMSAKVL